MSLTPDHIQLRTAAVYPASLQQKANGYRWHAWCNACQDGESTKTKAPAEHWTDAHNSAVHND